MTVGIDHFDLEGNRAIVLGADNPGGAAVALAYAEAGANLAVVASTPDVSLDTLCSEIEALGVAAERLSFDLTCPQGAAEAVESAVWRMGGVDVLACCSDLFFAKPVVETSDLDLTMAMTTNFGVQFAAVRSAAREMKKENRGGKLLLLTHVLGERGVANTAAYGAAHAAIQNLVRTVSRELGPQSITINAIALGWMDWMSDRISFEGAVDPVSFTVLKRFGRTEDVGPLAVWLSAGGAGFVTGQTFQLDGGLTQHR